MDKIYKNILDRYSLFMNEKYDFSNCKDIIIPIDELMKESFKEKFHKNNQFNFNFFKTISYDDYLSYTDILKEKTKIYFNNSIKQTLYTLTISFYKLVEKYDEEALYGIYRQILRLSLPLTLLEIYTLVLLIIEEAYLNGLKKDYFNNFFSIKEIGLHIFSFNNFMKIHFLQRPIDRTNGLAYEIYTLDYLNKLDINFFKMFWDNYYDQIFYDKIHYCESILPFQMIYPTLTNDKIEKIIFTLCEKNITSTLYLTMLNNINSQKIDLYRSFLLAQDLKN